MWNETRAIAANFRYFYYDWFHMHYFCSVEMCIWNLIKIKYISACSECVYGIVRFNVSMGDRIKLIKHSNDYIWYVHLCFGSFFNSFLFVFFFLPQIYTLARTVHIYIYIYILHLPLTHLSLCIHLFSSYCHI